MAETGDEPLTVLGRFPQIGETAPKVLWIRCFHRGGERGLTVLVKPLRKGKPPAFAGEIFLSQVESTTCALTFVPRDQLAQLSL